MRNMHLYGRSKQGASYGDLAEPWGALGSFGGGLIYEWPCMGPSPEFPSHCYRNQSTKTMSTLVFNIGNPGDGLGELLFHLASHIHKTVQAIYSLNLALGPYEFRTIYEDQLGGSRDFVTTYIWAYNPMYSLPNWPYLGYPYYD